MAAGRDVTLSATIVASWARYATGVAEDGTPIAVVDQRRKRVMAAAAQQSHDDLAFVRDTELFGDLAQQRAFTEPYVAALRSFQESGARATVEAAIAATEV